MVVFENYFPVGYCCYKFFREWRFTEEIKMYIKIIKLIISFNFD